MKLLRNKKCKTTVLFFSLFCCASLSPHKAHAMAVPVAIATKEAAIATIVAVAAVYQYYTAQETNYTAAQLMQDFQVKQPENCATDAATNSHNSVVHNAVVDKLTQETEAVLTDVLGQSVNEQSHRQIHRMVGQCVARMPAATRKNIATQPSHFSVTIRQPEQLSPVKQALIQESRRIATEEAITRHLAKHSPEYARDLQMRVARVVDHVVRAVGQPGMTRAQILQERLNLYGLEVEEPYASHLRELIDHLEFGLYDKKGRIKIDAGVADEVAAYRVVRFLQTIHRSTYEQRIKESGNPLLQMALEHIKNRHNSKVSHAWDKRMHAMSRIPHAFGRNAKKAVAKRAHDNQQTVTQLRTAEKQKEAATTYDLTQFKQDPLYAQLKLNNLDTVEKQKFAYYLLQDRRKRAAVLAQYLGIEQQTNHEVTQKLYWLIDHLDDPIACIDALMDLSLDSIGTRRAYSAFFDERGICKLINDPALTKDLELSRLFAKSYNTQARRYLNYLLILKKDFHDPVTQFVIDDALQRLANGIQQGGSKKTAALNNAKAVYDAVVKQNKKKIFQLAQAIAQKRFVAVSVGGSPAPQGPQRPDYEEIKKALEHGMQEYLEHEGVERTLEHSQHNR